MRTFPEPPNCVADDWGMSPGINEGILELCSRGLIRGVSLFGNLPHVEHGLNSLLELGGLRFSLHLNFTLGSPVSPPSEVRSLCGANGRFAGLGSFLRRALVGRNDSRELRLETRAQIRRLKSLGVPLTGLEGHHHVHLIPGVLPAAAPVLSAEGIEWLRIPTDPTHIASFASGLGFRGLRRLDGERGCRHVPTLYLREPDYRCTVRLNRKLLNDRRLPVIVHPAKYDDSAKMDIRDDYRHQRVAEYQGLMAWLEGAAKLEPGAKVSFWDEKILRWERARYSLLALANPCAWTVRSRLRAASRLLNADLKECRDVLDLGCGSGLLARSISCDPKRRYLGVDFSPAAIAAARRRFAPQAGRIRFQCADALAIPTADTGVCVFLGLLDWLSDEEASVLFSVRREPRLLFSFTEPDGFLSSLYRQYRRRADTTAYRARAFAEPDILRLLARGGYRAEKILRDPRLGPSCLVVAVKL